MLNVISPSTQAIRNGITEPKVREGIVIRPLVEVTLNNGGRVIAKHKRDEFRETASPKIVEGINAAARLAANALVEEYVTAMRFEHVVDQLIRERENKEIDMADVPALLRLMVADVKKEMDQTTIEDEKGFTKVVGAKVARMLKARLRMGIGNG